MKVSDRLEPGKRYSRRELADMFDFDAPQLYHGMFRPEGYSSVLLFVTERTNPGAREHRNLLRGDELDMEGQRGGRYDTLIADHVRLGGELLVFYRRESDAATGRFTYEGPFAYRSRETSGPARFRLQRQR